MREGAVALRIKAIGVFTVLTLGLTATPAQAAAWPGDSATKTADGTNVFGKNLSGLSFESANVVWAVKNSPSTLYRLVPSGAQWKVDQTRSLSFKNGQGDPDAEGVVSTPDGLFVVSERDNNDDSTSAPTVLKYGSGSAATSEWALPGMPDVDPNDGPEGIAWVPDSYLTQNGFKDDAGRTYNPADYPGHGSGLFFVGLEATGQVYVYALQGTAKLLAKFASGQSQVMELEFDGSQLWATCDNNCSGRATTFGISSGKFKLKATYNRPSTLPNANLEGFAISPSCVNGKKVVLWSDDDNTSSHAIRSGSLNCTV
ncbi:esterase-like activity of phytase family protein [Lentzea sp. NPDC005914]|uniref:esterase-like activity of phytase family protein n=1 Tax=Lentzea sp. NPDC005914 TaxID=3154572 RepID=UPI0033EF0AAC